VTTEDARNEPEEDQEPLSGRTAALTEPLILAEVRVSRQYRQHILYLPGAAAPTFHHRLDDAIDLAMEAGWTTLTLDIGLEHYRLSHLQEET